MFPYVNKVMRRKMQETTEKVAVQRFSACTGIVARFVAMLLVLFHLSGRVSAQYDVHFNHYWMVENFYNPAAMNLNEQLNLVGTYSLQMAGYTNAPSSMYFGANMLMPVQGKRQAAGVALFNEEIGLFSHRRILANYSYKFKFSRSWLNIGVQGGFLNESFDYSDIKTVDPNDPAFPSGDSEGTAFDFGAGLYYKHRTWHLGASVQHLTSPTVRYGKSNTNVELKIPMALFLNGGCNIRLTNPLLQVQPSFQACSDLDAYRIDLTCRGTYTYQEKMFYAGLTYSPATSVAFLLGGCVKGVTVGYAYELYTQGVGIMNGSHDLVVGYSMDVDLFKKGRNRHKTVRYL